MEDLPLFDALTHPTLSGEWMEGYDSVSTHAEKLFELMELAKIKKSMAVGMKGIGAYDEKQYIEILRPYIDYFVPIAFYDFDNNDDVKGVGNKLKKIKTLGYRGIKLHPRLSDFDLSASLLPSVIKQANDLGLVVLLCSYFYGKASLLESSRAERLAQLFESIEGAKLMLMHSGSVRLLEMIELCRSHRNILLDLSFTLCKYEGSSLDLDIQYAFESFDQRICVGSDFPDFKPDDLRRRFNHFSAHLQRDKAENIAYKNLEQFIGGACG